MVNITLSQDMTNYSDYETIEEFTEVTFDKMMKICSQFDGTVAAVIFKDIRYMPPASDIRESLNYCFSAYVAVCDNPFDDTIYLQFNNGSTIHFMTFNDLTLSKGKYEKILVDCIDLFNEKQKEHIWSHTYSATYSEYSNEGSDTALDDFLNSFYIKKCV